MGSRRSSLVLLCSSTLLSRRLLRTCRAQRSAWPLLTGTQLACAFLRPAFSRSTSSRRAHPFLLFHRTAQCLSAWIAVDGKPLEVYGRETNADGKVVGYGESAEGQAYTVHSYSARAFDGYDWAISCS